MNKPPCCHCHNVIEVKQYQSVDAKLNTVLQCTNKKTIGFGEV